MSKSRVSELVHLYEHLLKDAGYRFPTLVTEFEKDLIRLRRFAEQRGLPTLLVDLPAIGKHFDKCLSIGEYSLGTGPLTKRRSPRVMAPKFLGGLYLLVFDETGQLRSDPCLDAIYFIRQLCYVFKKVEIDCGPEKTLACVLEFSQTDASLPEPEKFWNASSPGELREDHPYQGFGRSELILARVSEISEYPVLRETSVALRTLDTVSSILASTLGAYSPSDWRFRHGPGAISETTSTSNKYSWKNWSDVLETEYPIADYGYHNLASWAGHCESRSVPAMEPTSRLIAVPKSFKGPRLIAAEPSEHQWCQQNIWHYFCDRTQGSFLSKFVRFRDQTLNQKLCSVGSRTGTTATLDLSEASDRMTCHVVGQFFRSNPKLLRCLRASRTRSVTQEINPRVDRLIRLRKFSTMGSACTFPVESLVFLGVALAAVLTHRGLKPTTKNLEALEGEVAVFGDDIVIPVDCRVLFVSLLEVLYFKVNVHKSFWTGRFRESCGVDSFDGDTVTPVYWKRAYDGKPESLASVVECSNNFYKKWLLNTAAYLASTVPKEIPRVHMTSGVFGLKTRFEPVNRGRTRYNTDFQHVEISVRSIKSKQEKSPTNDDTALLQYFTEEPSPLTQWVHGVAQRPKTKSLMAWVPLYTLGRQA